MILGLWLLFLRYKNLRIILGVSRLRTLHFKVLICEWALGMQLAMLLEIASRGEALRTQQAFVGTLIRMTANVNDKIRLPLVSLFTALPVTDVLGSVLMSLHVLSEMPWAFEGTATALDQAFVRFGLALVDKTVLSQVRLQFELLLALSARVQSDSHLQ